MCIGSRPITSIDRRRAIETAAAMLALSFIPDGFAEASATMTDVKLRNIRDMLSPALYGHSIPPEAKWMELSIDVDVENRCLLVKAEGDNRYGTKVSLGFAITSNSIANGSYKAQFRPSVLALIRCMNSVRDMEPVRFASLYGGAD